MSTKKMKSKSFQIKRHSSKMSVASPAKTRLVISVTEEEKKYIKILAALDDKSISDYLLENPRKKMQKSGFSCGFPGCESHEPNEETKRVFKDTDAGRNLESHDSLADFLNAMGME